MPDVGRITLDCGVLPVPGDDLRITVYTADPGTEDHDKLALAVVLGTQALTDRAGLLSPGVDSCVDHGPNAPVPPIDAHRHTAGVRVYACGRR